MEGDGADLVEGSGGARGGVKVTEAQVATAEHEAQKEAHGDRPVRFEGLEAFRGIAALMMVVFHSYQYSREGTQAERYVYEGTPADTFFRGLEAGVSWFFVLSGFLIFLPFAYSAVSQGSPRSARRFLVRRALRILPLYYVAILAVWSLRYTGSRAEWTDLLQHLTFTHVFSREHIFWTIGPAWSLAVEVIFYVFIAVVGPLAYLVCRPIGTIRGRAALLAVVVAALGAGSIAYKWWARYVAEIPEDNWPVYFGPLAKLDTFAMGMLLAILIAYLSARRSRFGFGAAPSSLLFVFGIVLLSADFLLRDDSDAVAFYFHTFSGAAFTLVLAATVLAGGSGERWGGLLGLLRKPVLGFIGVISYSVYMWHEPLLVELGKLDFFIDRAPQSFPQNAVVLVILSIVVGTLSYRLIEKPAMGLQHAFDQGKKDSAEETR